jgi:AcrR family transcriptional regulator
VRDAQIEDIAQAVGINRAIVYRHFTGKEELFALTWWATSTSSRVARRERGGSRVADEPAARTRECLRRLGLDHPPSWTARRR